MVVLQYNYEIIKSNVRSIFIDQISNHTYFITASCPITKWEQYIFKSSSSLYLPLITFINHNSDQFELVASITCLSDKMISSFAYHDDVDNDYDILNNSSSIRSNNYSDNKDNNSRSKKNDNYQYLAQSVLINIHQRSDCTNDECKVLINFTHDAIIYQSNQQIQLQTLSIFCDYYHVPKIHNYKCNNGYPIIIKCDGEFHGYINATCPYDKEQQQCLSYDNNQNQIASIYNNRCSVFDYSSTWTMCECNINDMTDSTTTVIKSTQPLPPPPSRIIENYFEVVPIITTIYIPSLQNYSHSIYPSIIKPINNDFPLITFGMKINTKIYMISYGSNILTNEDIHIFNQILTIVYNADNCNVIINEIKINEIDDNQYIINIIFDNLLTSNSFCTYHEAYNHYYHNIYMSLHDYTFIQFISNLGLYHKTIGNVLNDDLSILPFGITNYSSSAMNYACQDIHNIDHDNHNPTISPSYQMNDGDNNHDYINNINFETNNNYHNNGGEYCNVYLLCVVFVIVIIIIYSIYIMKTNDKNNSHDNIDNGNILYVQCLRCNDKNEELMLYNDETKNFEYIHNSYDDDNNKYDYNNTDNYKNSKRIIYSIENYEKNNDIFNGIIKNSNSFDSIIMNNDSLKSSISGSYNDIYSNDINIHNHNYRNNKYKIKSFKKSIKNNNS